jgi:exoribonuclease-2
VADHLRWSQAADCCAVAPFKPKDAELFSIISSFDAAYSAYNGFQSGIERYWTLVPAAKRVSELTASFMKDNLVRADELPLVLPPWAPGFAAQRKGSAWLGTIDEMTLDIGARYSERPGRQQGQRRGQTRTRRRRGRWRAGPISIAVDMNEPRRIPSLPEHPSPPATTHAVASPLHALRRLSTLQWAFWSRPGSMRCC